MSTDPSNETAQSGPPPDSAQPDLTGRERMVWNVLTSWAAHFVYVVAGFVMPRLIDGYLGQDALGVWDFAWALVVYFALIQGGIVSSVNRYVAMHRAAGDAAGVNRAVSSVTCILVVMGAIVLVLTVAAAVAVPRLFSDRLGAHAGDAGWVILWLGLALVAEVVFSGFGGVLTGCHRWDLHNAIYAGTYAITVAGMIAVLLSGGGLPQLALVTFGGELGGRLTRCFVAYRVCPGLRLRLGYVRWSVAWSMLTFGGKSFVPQVGDLLQNQTISILILAYLGPAALALYSRPRALVRHVQALVTKFSRVLTPTASSLQAMGQLEELRELLVKGTRYGAYIALPMVLGLTVLGGPLLELWMGPRYTQGAWVLAVLAVGHLAMLGQRPVLSVLKGMNAHGLPGVANLLAAIASIALGILALGPLRLGLVAAALAVTVPLTIANGLYVPVYACRRLDLPLVRYVFESLRGPILCGIPFGGCLVAARVIYADRPFVALAVGTAVGAVVLAGLYWCFVLPASLKRTLIGLVRPKRLAAAAKSA